MRNRKGFTLVELIISISIVGLVFGLAGDFFLNTYKIPNKTQNEYSIQSNMRIVTTNITQIIRDATATFAIFGVTETSAKTDGWNYIYVNDEGTSVIKSNWNFTTSSRDPDQIVVESLPGVTYSLRFKKINPSSADRLLEYEIVATINGETRSVQSEVEALNSLQVIDRSSGSNLANTLAYRSDSRIIQEVANKKAAISIVLDKSGSMSSNLDGSTRIAILKEQALNLINDLASSANTFATIVPFDYDANGNYEMVQVRNNSSGGPEASLTSIIDGLSASGYTNTGDGIRRGYYALEAFGEDYPEYDEIMNYMIILVDGESNYYSYYPTGRWTWEYQTADGNAITTNDNSTNARTYVTKIGTEKVIKYGVTEFIDRQPISVYVIGFANDISTTGLNNIATATAASSVEQAGSAVELDEIFTSIQSEIIASLWHVSGPN
ncbi:MAG: VWA domain-containing protein [Eubacteriales bacterium]|nr:VWA domain-containing protein [Eubacteriales bacterium]